jgi:hypothetical protein
MAGGRPVRTDDGKTGVVFEPSPEAESFDRWRRSEFHEIERDAVSSWRDMLSNLNLSAAAQKMMELGVTRQACKTIQEAYGIAARLVHTKVRPRDQLALLSIFVDIPTHLHAQIIVRWETAGFPALATYAPYAARVLTVELFFQLALGAKLVSSDWIGKAGSSLEVGPVMIWQCLELFVSCPRRYGKPIWLKTMPPFPTVHD